MLIEIHALLVALPAFTYEPIPETPDERAERLEPVAWVLYQEGQTPPAGFTSIQWVSVHAALIQHETNLAKYVQDGKCETGPEGMRCDNGKARGLWQQHESACRPVWAAEPGSFEELQAGARCASRLLKYAMNVRCLGAVNPFTELQVTPLAGAFAGYAGRPCDWVGAENRECTARKMARDLKELLEQKNAA